MTATDTIEQLQRALDVEPDSWTLRLALADALEESGSELSLGYRAMAVCKRNSCDYDPYPPRTWYPTQDAVWLVIREQHPEAFDLPRDWLDLLQDEQDSAGGGWWDWKRYPNRRAAEDEAARAFNLLSEGRQRELLEGKL